MKTPPRWCSILVAFATPLLCHAAKKTPPPTDTVLFSFKDSKALPGKTPSGCLVTDGASFYGTTLTGRGKAGVIYKLDSSNHYTVLHTFADGENATPFKKGLLDPGFPLTLVGSTLYGVAYGGGANSSPGHGPSGLIYSIGTDGSNFTKLHEFPAIQNDGRNPVGTPLVSGGVIYGVTANGGAHSVGVIYRLNTNGTGYQVLRSMDLDSGFPTGSLKLVGSTLYGTTFNPLPGAIHKIQTDGTGYTQLHVFGSGGGNGLLSGNGLVAIGSTFYGLTYDKPPGGKSSVYSIFTYDTNGGAFHQIAFTDILFQGATNVCGSLALVNGVLVGITGGGGTHHAGAIFRINPDGSDYSRLFSFGPAGKGINPGGALLPSADGSLVRGTTTAGGAVDKGTIFSFPIAPAGA